MTVATAIDYSMPTINMMPRIETTLVHGYPGDTENEAELLDCSDCDSAEKVPFQKSGKKYFAHRCSITHDRDLVNHFLHPEFS